MKNFGWLLIAARKPVESILFIFSLGLLAYALYVMSPIYEAGFAAAPGGGAVVGDAFPKRIHEFALAAMFLIASLPGLIAPFVEKPRTFFLKISSFGLFLAFWFLTILRLVIYGPVPVTWIHLISVALASGVCRLYLEVRKD